MSLSPLRSILLASAALLTVSGFLPVFDGCEGPQATFVEIEDVEEDEREEFSSHVAVAVTIESGLHDTVVHLTGETTCGFFRGPQSVRGPPRV